MSTTRKEVYTLDVILTDQNEHTQTFKIDNPASGVTMTQVRQAWANVIDATTNLSGKQLLYSRYDLPFTEVTNAQKVVIVTTREDLPE